MTRPTFEQIEAKAVEIAGMRQGNSRVSHAVSRIILELEREGWTPEPEVDSALKMAREMARAMSATRNGSEGTKTFEDSTILRWMRRLIEAGYHNGPKVTDKMRRAWLGLVDNYGVIKTPGCFYSELAPLFEETKR